jgi:hypothetical protein
MRSNSRTRTGEARHRRPQGDTNKLIACRCRLQQRRRVDDLGWGLKLSTARQLLGSLLLGAGQVRHPRPADSSFAACVPALAHRLGRSHGRYLACRRAAPSPSRTTSTRGGPRPSRGPGAGGGDGAMMRVDAKGSELIVI